MSKKISETAKLRSQDSPVLPRVILPIVIAPLISGLVLLLISANLTVVSMSGKLRTDLPIHSTLLPELLEKNSYVYSSWYYFQLAIVGDPRNTSFLLNAALIILTIFYFLKGFVIAQLHLSAGTRPLHAMLISIMIGSAIAFPWPGRNSYLGTIPPNVFHSATQLVALVFGIIAIFFTCMFASKSSTSRPSLLAVSLASLGSGLAKPALTPALLSSQLLVIAWLTWTKQRSLKELYRFVVLVTMPSLILFAAGYYFTYQDGGVRSTFQVVVRPFAEWSIYSHLIPLDLLRSVIFPLTVFILLVRERRFLICQELTTAWVIFLISVIPMAMFAELDLSTNLIVGSGNFFWGPMIANAGLYVISSIQLQKVTSKRRLIAYVVILVQGAWGIWYVMNFIQTGSKI